MGFTVDATGNVTWADDIENKDIRNAYPSQEVANATPHLDELTSAISGIKLPNINISLPNPTPVPSTVSSGSSIGTSESGTDLNKFNTLQTVGRKGIDKAKAEAHNEAAAYGNAVGARINDTFDKKSAATASYTNAEADMQAYSAKLDSDYAMQAKQNALDNAKDYASIQLKTQKYMDDYKNSLAELAAMHVNPGRAYSNMSSGQKAGTLITAFVTDFLGAKGIKTSGMDYINKAIDMDIQAQRDAIEGKKGEVAGKFNIYQMYKEQGDSDYQAATKTRAAMLDAVGLEAKAKLAAVNSDLTRAKIPLLDSMIAEEKLKLDTDLAKDVQNIETTKVNQAIQLRGQDLQASASARSARIAERQLEAQEKQLRASGLLDEMSRLVVSPNGKVLGTINKNDDWKKVTEHVGNVSDFTDLLKDYNQKVIEVGRAYGGPGSQAFAGAAKLIRLQMHERLAFAIAKMNNPDGKISDADRDAADRILKMPGWSDGIFSDEGIIDATTKAAGTYGANIIREYTGYLNQHIIKADPELVAAYENRVGPMPGSTDDVVAKNTLFNSQASGNYTKGTDTTVDRMVGKIWSSGEKNSALVESSELATEIASKAGVLPWDSNGRVPRYIAEMDKLAKTISSGGAESGKAFQSLWLLANPDQVTTPDGKVWLRAVPEEVQKAAWLYLMDIKERPNAGDFYSPSLPSSHKNIEDLIINAR